MRRIISIHISFLCILMLIGYLPVTASQVQTNSTTDQNVIPDDFLFYVSHECTSHEYFTQAAATERGSFLLVSRYTDIKENKDLVYKQRYIDVYSPEGTFLVELCFYTEQEFVAELMDSSVNLYFYDRVICYDLETGTLQGELTSPRQFIENGTYDRLRKSSFIIGDWEYRCVKGFHGYKQFIRTAADGDELIISFSGNRATFGNTIILAIVFCVVLSYLRVGIKRKRK